MLFEEPKMSLLGKIAAIFGIDYYGKYDSTNPISPRLSYFFNYVVPKHPEQADLLFEYSNHPELRPEILLRTNKSGDITEVLIVDKEEYSRIKKTLKIS